MITPYYGNLGQDAVEADDARRGGGGGERGRISRPHAEEGRHGRWGVRHVRATYSRSLAFVGMVPLPCMLCQRKMLKYETEKQTGNMNLWSDTSSVTMRMNGESYVCVFLSTKLVRAGLLWPEPAPTAPAVKDNR